MTYYVTHATRAKISHFQNMLGFIQYGRHSFSKDASNDPTSKGRGPKLLRHLCVR